MWPATLRRQGYRLSVLGVGSAEPAPIPDPQGGFVRDAQGKIVMPTLEVAQLQSLASAGGGRYHTITVNDTDLAHVLPASLQALDSRLESTEQSTDIWQSQGPWLVLVLLPLAALAFRRGWLLALPLVITVTLGSLPQPAMASAWDDLWQRHDQQAAQALQAGDAERARQLAEHPLLRGEAAYRAGDFAAALDAFSASDTAQGNYNRGNALAQLGRYQEAIAAYDEALARDPALEDASHNKQELEKLLQQQQAENQKNGDSEDQADRQQADDQGNGDSEDRAEQQQAENQDGDASEDKADQNRLTIRATATARTEPNNSRLKTRMVVPAKTTPTSNRLTIRVTATARTGPHSRLKTRMAMPVKRTPTSSRLTTGMTVTAKTGPISNRPALSSNMSSKPTRGTRNRHRPLPPAQTRH